MRLVHWRIAFSETCARSGCLAKNPRWIVPQTLLPYFVTHPWCAFTSKRMSNFSARLNSDPFFTDLPSFFGDFLVGLSSSVAALTSSELSDFRSWCGDGDLPIKCSESDDSAGWSTAEGFLRALALPYIQLMDWNNRIIYEFLLGFWVLLISAFFFQGNSYVKILMKILLRKRTSFHHLATTANLVKICGAKTLYS